MRYVVWTARRNRPVVFQRTQGMLTLQFLLFTHSKDFSKNFQTEQQCKLAGLNWNYGRLLTELVRGLSFGFRPVLSVLFWVFFVFVNQDPASQDGGR